MAEIKQVSKLPTASELVAALKAKSNDWVSRFVGQANHNPYLRTAQLIQPLVIELSVKDAVVTQAIVDKVNALPADPAPLNPDWKPEVKPSIILPPEAKIVGAKNLPS